jgi:hypothetical protein
MVLIMIGITVPSLPQLFRLSEAIFFLVVPAMAFVLCSFYAYLGVGFLTYVAGKRASFLALWKLRSLTLIGFFAVAASALVFVAGIIYLTVSVTTVTGYLTELYMGKTAGLIACIGVFLMPTTVEILAAEGELTHAESSLELPTSTYHDSTIFSDRTPPTIHLIQDDK